MSHSFSKIWIHAVWSTKHRQPFIDSEIESRVHKMIADEFRQLDCSVGIINGMPDHVHCLFLMNPNMSVASVLKQVKGSSSHLINQRDWVSGKFSWQVGYSAFSVSESSYIKAFRYIKHQKMHHAAQSSMKESVALLKLHGCPGVNEGEELSAEPTI